MKKLLAEGIFTEQEFAEQKAKILSGKKEKEQAAKRRLVLLE